MTDWLEVRRGDAPLVVGFPHTGLELPDEIAPQLSSSWLARKDADHWVHLLYDFVSELGATSVRTQLARSVIDVNRDPSGRSLYPGQTTTELCPLHTFDGEPLYAPGREPDAAEIERRRARYFAPYHAALGAELSRLQARHGAVVLYDAHSIRSEVPRLFAGVLPHLNLGTFDGQSCAPELGRALAERCASSDFDFVIDGRFKGGWTTRHYGQPSSGVHAVQMELACRGYLREPAGPLTEHSWPPAYDPEHASALRGVLRGLVGACIDFARTTVRRQP